MNCEILRQLDALNALNNFAAYENSDYNIS